LNEPILRLEQISKQIGHRTILQRVDLTLERGERVALLGPNGAGKSTLLRIAATLLKPTSGRVFIGGRPAADHPAVRARLGVVLEPTLFYLSLTARENLALYARLYRVPEPGRRAAELLDQVGLTLFADEPVRTFSRGMRQRLALARAVVHAPDLLLLDEPYTALDQEGCALMNELLVRSARRGCAVLVITHDLEPGGSPLPVDRAVLLEAGRVKDEVAAPDLRPEPGWLGRWYQERVSVGLRQA